MFTQLGVVSRRIGNVAKNSLTVVGFGTTLYALREYYEIQKLKDNDGMHASSPSSSDAKGNNNGETKAGSKKKKVLVIPFDKLKVVERKAPMSIDSLFKSSKESDPIETIELRTLVDTIHEAAKDPDIVALYGTFGNGFRFSCGGYAHLEEIRNAIQVFNESHRTHYEPKRKNYNNIASSSEMKSEQELEQEQISQCQQQKYSYAYADSFDDPTSSANNEYFLASAFSKIHLQPRGSLNLFGVSTTNLFVKNALDKYGIKAHVFKHGKYKNAPNMFTERSYTKAHLENTKGFIKSINDTIHASITHSRNLHDQFQPKVWQSVHDYGTLSAQNAQEINLIDHLPKKNPLYKLIKLNSTEHNNRADGSGTEIKWLSELRKNWTWLLNEQNEQKLIADEALPLKTYMKILAKREKLMKRYHGWNKMIDDAASKSSAAKVLLKQLGWKAPFYNLDESLYNAKYMTEEKIAIVNITGGIDDKISRNVVHSLHKIKKDENVKAVILRVDSPGGSVTASETILEECKDLPVPIICSFANLAASGGYYVSTHADRIFASPTTLTGSIGVFGIKLDASGLARSYGVEANFVSSGKHAQTYNSLYPLTKKIKMNLQRNIDKIYDYFKEIVSQGRNIPFGEVEEIAQGRVWTGVQAKEKRLVDELGGLDRALNYAKRKYTSCGYADVEVYPKPLTMSEKLKKLSEMEANSLLVDDYGYVYDRNEFHLDRNDIGHPLLFSYDETMKTILLGDMKMIDLLTRLPRVLLTMDESTAVQQMLKEASDRK